MKFRHAKVKTFDSHRHPGRPVSFSVTEDELEVDEIIDRWSEAYQDPSFFPDDFYKVKASDGKVYILKYSTLFKSWWVKEFEGLMA